MQLDSNLRTERTHAFTLKKSDIEKIWHLMQQEIGGDLDALIKFSDSIERTAETIDEVLKFENSKTRKIERIEFSARNRETGNKAHLIFEDYKGRPIQIIASGDDTVVTSIGDKMQELIDGLKPWYSVISKLDFVYIVGFIVFFIFALANVMIPDGTNKERLNLLEGVRVMTILISALIVIVFSTWGFNQLKAKYFPVASFAIGQGEERHRIEGKVRWGVIISLLVSITASAVFTILKWV